MNSTFKPLIVIPALNEQATIGEVISETQSTYPNYDILVVDDGSTDMTLDQARRAGVIALRMPFNTGVGAAMRLGFRYASENNYDAVVQVDADGQHNIEDIQKLLLALNKFDVVVGSRFAPGANSFKLSWLRRTVMALIAKLTSKLVGALLTDVTSGFRAANTKALETFKTKYPPEYLGDTIESLVIAHREGLTIGEIPTSISKRKFGNSSQSNLRAIGYTLRALFVILLASIHKKEK